VIVSYGFQTFVFRRKEALAVFCSETVSVKWASHRTSHRFSPPVPLVWITKYRYKVLEGALRERIRTIIRQVCKELRVQIVSGVLSREHVHMFVEIPPQIGVSDFVRRVKGRSSHRAQMEFPELRKRYWGRHFWARGYFCTTSGNITDDVILQYIRLHEPPGVSR
jgi:putative transposase